MLRRPPNLRVGVGSAIDVRDPHAGDANGPAERSIPGALHAVALGADFETDLANAHARVKPLVLVSHGGDAHAGNQRHRHRSWNIVALDDVHAAVFATALPVLDEGLKLSREAGRVFHVEGQLPSPAERVAQGRHGPFQIEDDLALIGAIVQLDPEHE
jgi:hypothetical protein